MLHQERSRFVLLHKQQEAVSLSEALITPDKKLQQQSGSAGSSSRRLFASGEPTQRDVNSSTGDCEEVQSRKRFCQAQCSYDAPAVGEQETSTREQTKRQATRRLFGCSPSPEQMDQFFKDAELQVCSLPISCLDHLCIMATMAPWRFLYTQMLTSWTRSLYCSQHLSPKALPACDSLYCRFISCQEGNEVLCMVFWVTFRSGMRTSWPCRLGRPSSDVGASMPHECSLLRMGDGDGKLLRGTRRA